MPDRRTPAGFLFRADTTGRFVDRPNRFLIEAKTDDGTILAHCANPGRLAEILLPGVELIFEQAQKASRKTAFTAVAAYHRGEIVPLVSQRANRIAELALTRLIPNVIKIRAEYPIGSSRFDFLVQTASRSHLVEPELSGSYL